MSFAQASIAGHFEMLNGDMGTEPDYLRKLVQRFGLAKLFSAFGIRHPAFGNPEGPSDNPIQRQRREDVKGRDAREGGARVAVEELRRRVREVSIPLA